MHGRGARWQRGSGDDRADLAGNGKYAFVPAITHKGSNPPERRGNFLRWISNRLFRGKGERRDRGARRLEAVWCGVVMSEAPGQGVRDRWLTNALGEPKAAMGVRS